MSTSRLARWTEAFNAYQSARVEFTHACARLVLKPGIDPQSAN